MCVLRQPQAVISRRVRSKGTWVILLASANHRLVWDNSLHSLVHSVVLCVSTSEMHGYTWMKKECLPFASLWLRHPRGLLTFSIPRSGTILLWGPWLARDQTGGSSWARTLLSQVPYLCTVSLVLYYFWPKLRIRGHSEHMWEFLSGFSFCFDKCQWS